MVDGRQPSVVTATIITGQGRIGRRITQVISSVIHDGVPSAHGIRYLSNGDLNNQLECWATFLDRSAVFEQVDAGKPDAHQSRGRVPWSPSSASKRRGLQVTRPL